MAHVLIADDDPTTRTYLSNVLRAFGHRITTCDDGLEAWRILAQDDRVDLLVTDVIMPGLRGDQLHARLRQDGRWRELPVLLISAVIDTTDLASSTFYGPTVLLTKPVDALRLRQEIERLLNPRRRSTTASDLVSRT